MFPSSAHASNSASESASAPAFAELHCLSNFSFLRGASHPQELVTQARKLGYQALAITDECSLAGVVRAHVEAKKAGLPLIIGSEFKLDDGLHFLLLATDQSSYGRLSLLITAARRKAEKGHYHLTRDLLQEHHPSGCLAIWLPGQFIHNNQHVYAQLSEKKDNKNGAQNSNGNSSQETQIRWIKEQFPHDCWIGLGLFRQPHDPALLANAQQWAAQFKIPIVACNDIHMHRRNRQPLQDVLTATRHKKPVAELGYELFGNAEHYLRSIADLATIYPNELLAETINISNRCQFSLDELRYQYPSELVPKGHTATSWLRQLIEQGMAKRWPETHSKKAAPQKVKDQIEHDLGLIQEMAYEPYFLTVHDIVRFARAQNTLCQGRGSAANSAVCYCLFITEVDPARMNLLFERFISKERNEPPDIDVDFEHVRREEVIQYIYKKYGRDRAALAASITTYRTRSAVRDVGKALGLSNDQIDRLARGVDRWDNYQLLPERLRECGLDPNSPVVKQLGWLISTLVGFPRHLSQHVGGFVISEQKLSQLVPIENANMTNRTVIQWDKNDLEALGLMKVDILALGILSAIRKALKYLSDTSAKTVTMQDIPAEDPAVYAMLQRGESIGIFQIESRAQMSMLPRLKPANYYDLVVQIAIVRPGPIQGDMVHPYLARRAGREPVDYPSPEVKTVLERTLGIPIFQEQVMQLAIVAAGFTPGEADQLRRAMAAWKRKGGLEPFETKLKNGMRERGYPTEFAERIFNQIKGFGDYGFPESHSASFALLAYVSSWLRCYHPAIFTCALLNSQPMGFYRPSQLIQDAQSQDVEVQPVDVRFSEYDCSLEKTKNNSPILRLRLGLRMVKGFSAAAAQSLIACRNQKPFSDITDLVIRSQIDRGSIECLAAADALNGLSGNRHNAYWDVAGVEPPPPLFERLEFHEGKPLLPIPTQGQSVIADYAATGASLRSHPLALLRSRFNSKRVHQAKDLWSLRNGCLARVAGLVICRQRPQTASGVTFVTLEDESGQTNIIVWPSVGLAQRKALLSAQLLLVTGTVQQEDKVLHLIAGKLEDCSDWLGGLDARSRDFH
ncbi:MAG: error-prone DNA polymerase [Pseudomonadales bacterium]|nr:error-prone DNA polymerase [Pseudomonadales bacterium]